MVCNPLLEAASRDKYSCRGCSNDICKVNHDRCHFRRMVHADITTCIATSARHTFVPMRLTAPGPRHPQNYLCPSNDPRRLHLLYCEHEMNAATLTHLLRRFEFKNCKCIFAYTSIVRFGYHSAVPRDWFMLYLSKYTIPELGDEIASYCLGILRE